MKQMLAAMLTLALFLPMISCSHPAWETEELSVQIEEPAYQLQDRTTASSVADEEGRPLAAYRYETVEMKTSAAASQALLDTASAFNKGMEKLLSSCVETGEQLDDWARLDQKREAGTAYEDRLDATCWERGDVINVRFDSHSEYGGKSWDRTFSYLFDLTRQCYIDPLEVADDPEQFRSTVAELILEELADSTALSDQLYGNYEQTVAQWNHCGVSFEDMLTITFSTYDISSGGSIAFRFPYDKVGLGEGGLEKLGLTEKTAD